MSDVGTVDLRDFESAPPTETDRFCAELGRSLVDTGFVKVAGHGIAPALLDRAYAVAAQVFALPEPAKERYDRSDLHGARGFIPFGREQAKDASVIDLKEFWHIGRARGGRFDNVWPDEVPAFESVMGELFAAMEQTAQTLLEALSVFLGLQRRHLADLAVDADPLLRVLHYPPIGDRHRSMPDSQDAVRAAAHEDINFITLLPAATDAGLELRDRSGRWSTVDGSDGELIVDSGDMLSRYLNGRIPATTHRVVNPDDPAAERYSMPFFCQPRRDILLVPPAELLEPGEVIRDEPITAGEFHQQRMDQIRATRDS
ncbi:2-oxoglutarate and iron-dependent oxygenase domain-containing protein [soil metagenome]